MAEPQFRQPLVQTLYNLLEEWMGSKSEGNRMLRVMFGGLISQLPYFLQGLDNSPAAVREIRERLRAVVDAERSAEEAELESLVVVTESLGIETLPREEAPDDEAAETPVLSDDRGAAASVEPLEAAQEDD